jgi:hypothetical protein
LDSTLGNTTFTEEELALVLPTGKVGVQGAFLRVG